MCSPWQAMHSNKSAFVYTFPLRTNNHFFSTGNFTCHCATGANECAACHAPTPFHGMTFPSRASKSKCRELRPKLWIRCLVWSVNKALLLHFPMYVCSLFLPKYDNTITPHTFEPHHMFVLFNFPAHLSPNYHKILYT